MSKSRQILLEFPLLWKSFHNIYPLPTANIGPFSVESICGFVLIDSSFINVESLCTETCADGLPGMIIAYAHSHLGYYCPGISLSSKIFTSSTFKNKTFKVSCSRYTMKTVEFLSKSTKSILMQLLIYQWYIELII